jgi:SAM-dependent methyltransferase
LYSTDLAYIHDTGFGEFADRAAPEAIRILRTHGLRRGRLVEVGCGSGTLARHLVDAGYDLVGFDISPAMIRLARAKVPEARFRVASLSEARIPSCHAVMAIGEVLTYVSAGSAVGELARSVQQFFVRVYAALKLGGLFIFDFIESADRRTYPAKSRGGSDWAIVARAEVDRPGRVLTRRLVMVRKVGRQFRRSQEIHRVRIYGRAVIARALSCAGFTFHMSRSYGRYRLMPGSVAVIAQKHVMADG